MAVTEQGCIWCAHAEEDHSAIFGECLRMTEDALGASQWCKCKEYQAPPKSVLSLRDRIWLGAAALWAWLLMGWLNLLTGGPLGYEDRTLRGWWHFLEELERRQ